MARRHPMLRAAAASLLLAVTVPSVFSQVILVPPPAPRYERAPAPRPGQAWRPGYWQWARGGYVWAPGYWVAPTLVPNGGYVIREAREPAPPPRVERLSADALFAFDRGDVSGMSASGRADIAKVAADLNGQRFHHVEIRGYTDRLGTNSYNLDLSRRRADAVKSVLVEQGIPADKIETTGLGPQDPIVQCDRGGQAELVRCLQPNRRVEIVTYIVDAPRAAAPAPRMVMVPAPAPLVVEPGWYGDRYYDGRQYWARRDWEERRHHQQFREEDGRRDHDRDYDRGYGR